jgi:hypothetical protein
MRSYVVQTVRVLVGAFAFGVTPLAAQTESPDSAAVPDSAAAPRLDIATVRRTTLPVRPLVTIGSILDERARLDQILGTAGTSGYLIRTPSTLTPRLRDDTAAAGWALLAPEIHVVRNPALPSWMNEGSLWAGRGTSFRITAGMRAEYGPFSLTVAPELVTQRDKNLQSPPPPFPDRSPYASPWPRGPGSIDLPQRMGEDFFRIVPGQSVLSFQAGPVVFGGSTESQWWGPGVRNAIVMSNNAAGIPHLFVRTSSPVRTPLGELEGRWIVGGLSESPNFDFDASNDLRSISALAATFRPVWEPDLTLGFARAVYAPADGASQVPGRFLDVLVRSGRAIPTSGTSFATGPDQILSVFGRWVFPPDGLEVYAEWAREEVPNSVRDLFAAPNHSQGYTLGLQWARPVDGDAVLRLQTELTYLEQSGGVRGRPVTSYYVSPSVQQGYTHRGKVIGAGIGPGASSQWLAADYVAPHWQFGGFVGRIRWENDAYYTQALDGRLFLAHDVSMLFGVRGHVRLPGMAVRAELGREKRFNYLFQNRSADFEGRDAKDVTQTTLRLTLTPGLGRGDGR